MATQLLRFPRPSEHPARRRELYTAGLREIGGAQTLMKPLSGRMRRHECRRAAGLAGSGLPYQTPIFGGAWDRDRFHWTKEAAEREALEMASDLGLSPVQWTEISEVWAIGRCHKIGRETDLYGVTVRGVLLPLGPPP